MYKSDNGRVVLLFNLRNGRMEDPHYIYQTFPEYELRSDGLNYRVKFADRKAHETVDISVTEKYIYMMVSPHIQDEPYKGCPYYYGDQVLVFDWEGNKVREFTTDRPFSSFEVDENNEYLYAMGQDVETKEDLPLRYKIN